MKLVLLSIFVYTARSQTCAVGCLSCKKSDTCLLSDVERFYKLSEGKPVREEIPNCQFMTIQGDCVYCKENFDKDHNTNECVPLTNENTMDNCEEQSGFVCLRCSPGYFFSFSKCVVIEKPIENCLYYVYEEMCSQCKEGYLVTQTKKECFKINTIPNCGFYSNVSCRTCVDGYVKNKNKFLTDFIFNFQWDPNVFVSFLKDTFMFKGGPLLKMNECELLPIEGCLTYNESERVCRICKEGFILTEKGNCQKNPFEVILNCKDYSNETTCKECFQGFYIKNKGCQQITEEEKIFLCEEYDGKKDYPFCLKCLSDFYVKENNCVLREVSIGMENCEEISPDSDNCSLCSGSYIPNTTKTNCIKTISNCKEHLFNEEGDSVKCQECEKGFFIESGSDSKSCVDIPFDNCSSYDPELETCLICSNGYFKDNGVCSKSNSLDNCEVYSSTDGNTCEQCQEDKTLNFKIEKACYDVIDKTPNCSEYDITEENEIKCESCDIGYSLNNGKCNLIEIDNCVGLDSNGDCSLCINNFGLSKDKKSCKPIFDVFEQDCLITNLSSNFNDQFVGDAFCSVCEENKVPVDIKDTFICLKNEDIKEISSSIVLIDDCLKYDNNSKCVLCDPNSQNKYLVVDELNNFCTSDCNSSYRLVIEEQKNFLWNVCLESPDNNCRVYGPNSSSEQFDQICLHCKNNFLPVVDLQSNTYSTISPDGESPFPYQPFIFSKYLEVDCIDSSNITIEAFDSSTIDSCESFKSIGDNKFVCVKCKFGSSGVINSTGHINNCSSQNNFNTNKRLYNIDLIWEKLFSFHECSEIEEIPFIAYESVSNKNPFFSKFTSFKTTPNEVNFKDDNSSSYSIFCEKNSKETFNLVDKYGIDENCGLGVLLVNTNGHSNFESNIFGTFCAACKPGYKPVEHQNFSFVKTKCVEIENCSSDNLFFNSCQKCEQNYIHRFINDKIDYQHCHFIPEEVSFKFENCEVASFIGETIQNCFQCKKGFYLNLDNICEDLKPRECEQGNLNKREKITSNQLPWALYYKSYFGGCQKCKEGFSAIEINTPKKMCLESSYINNRVDGMNKSETNYVPDCLQYKSTGDSNPVCYKCKDNHVIKGDITGQVTGEECFEQNTESMKSCLLAQSSFSCLKCKDSSYLFFSNCYSGTDVNCSKYTVDNTTNLVLCDECLTDYYVDNQGKCKIGNIKNCKKYVTGESDKCQECDSGFVKTNIAEDKDFCYPVSSKLNCSTAKIVQERSVDSVECLSCLNPYSTVLRSPVNNEDKTICMDFTTIQSCITHSKDTRLFNSQLGCSECEEGFYYNKERRRCFSRLNIPAKCIEFDSYTDECVSCDFNSFLSEDKTNCVDFPSGVFGCKSYVNYTSCSLCKEGLYLDNNKCLQVTNKIDNCLYYDFNGICNQCEFSYILNNNSCDKSTALNCKDYLSVSKCKSCPSLYGFVTEEDKVDCELQDKDNCVDIDPNPPYNCLECAEEHYIEEGGCVKTTTPIHGCAVYSNNNECQRCKLTFTLSLDKTKCKSFFEINNMLPSNCKDSIETEEYNCSKCDMRYRNEEGSCNLICQGSALENCFICDPSIRNKCLICESGFFLSNGTCLKAQICLVDNCIQCDEFDSGRCLTCAGGYFVNNSICEKTCLPNEQHNCFNCDVNNRDNCLECHSGYSLIDNRCFPICKNIAMPNCKFCNSGSDVCLDCLPGFFLNEGVCYKLCKGPGKDNCLVCHEDNRETCLLCDADFFLEDNTCIEKCKEESLEGCLICDIRGEKTCLKCEKEYKMVEGSCERFSSCKDTNCLSCTGESEGGICSICKNGYEIDIDNICVKKGIKIDKNPKVDNTDSEFIRNTVFMLSVLFYLI